MMNFTMTQEAIMNKVAENKNNNPATKGQIATIRNIATQKNITIDESKLETFGDADAYIKDLINTKASKQASEKQIEIIKNNCDLLNRAYPDFNQLTGGMEGTASKLIQYLLDETSKIEIPANEKQISFIENIMLCPDCEKIDISSISKSNASEYINKNKTKYYSWLKDRLSENQMLSIVRLNCLIDGKEVDDIIRNDEYSVMEKVNNLISRQQMDFKALIQFDKPLATKYIQELEMELKSAIWKETTLEGIEMRGIKTTIDSEYKDQEYIKLSALIIKLYEVAGQALEEEAIHETMKAEGIEFFALKEIVDHAKLWNFFRVKNILEDSELFEDAYVEALLA